MQRASVLLSQTLVSPVVTHTVFNQAPFLENFNVFESNKCLQDVVKTFGASGRDATEQLRAYGAICGDATWIERAKEANEREPVWTPFDKQGRRIDTAKFCESYHRLMDVAITNRVPSLAWGPDKNMQVSRCALSYMHYQLECGTGCPLTMTYAAVPPLRANKEFAQWADKLSSGFYDGRDVAASLKKGLTCGMSMTEKQGGSDVRSNTTTATPIDGPQPASWDVAPGAKAFHLCGHKWFTSAPMCDGFLTLAQAEGGLACFLVPRWLSPTERNTGLRFQRLKAKLGDKSNASSEVEYHNAVGFLVGKLGRGVPTIIEMVNHTRLDCMLGSSALMQAALMQAVHHAHHRSAFGGILADKPLMANVLTDLALEAEGATALAFRVAASFDNPKEEMFKRIATAIGKYYVCKRAPAHVYECLECLGGNGYTEDFPLARWFRQSPLNAVWEGSGNVIVLDVFRAMANPATFEALSEEVHSVNNADISAAFADVAAALRRAVKDGSAELYARRFVEQLAVILEACAIAKGGIPAEVRDAFIQSRIVAKGGASNRLSQFGTLALPSHLAQAKLFNRHRPILPSSPPPPQQQQ